jgi:hypothetical protein
MRRRLVWGLTALVAALAIPAPAQSDTQADAAPRIRVVGIAPDAAPGGPRRSPIPRLVRAGSDQRADGGGAAGPVSQEPGGVLAPTVVGTAFDGVPDTEKASPGDPTGALGVNYHLAAVNVRMAFYPRGGGDPLDQPRLLEDLDTALPDSVDSFDPKVVYDPYRQHFILVFLSADATRSFITVVPIPEGEEDTMDTWCPIHMSGDQVGSNGKQFADYPMVGFTEDRVTLTTNQFNFDDAPFIGGFQYVQVVSFRKTQLYNCAVSPVIKVFSGNQTRDPDGSRAFTIVPAVSFGGSPTVQFMTSMDFNGSTGKLILWRLKVVNGVLRLSRASLGGGPMTYPRWGRQCPGDLPGLNDNWDTGDLRHTSAFWDGGRRRLYTATARDGNIGGGATESVIRWWEVDPVGNSDVTRAGIIGAAGRDLAWPSIATDGAGKLWVNYARAGSGQCLSAYASVIQPGAKSAASVLIQEGERRYEYGPGVERWGDYTAISRDPLDPATMAAYGAYPIDDGVGGDPTRVWEQVIATLTDA